MNKKKKYINECVGRLESDIIMVLCDCGGTDHHLIITKDKDEKKPHISEYYVAIIPVQPSFWTRIKWGFDYMIHGPHLDEIVLHKDQMKRLAKALNKIK